jgi:MYXO-CTERM domain-containing protein
LDRAPRSLALASAALLLVLAAPASALTITYDLDFEFSNASPPAGPTPWMTVSIDDSVGGPNDVRITITNVNLTGVEFISEVTLNFDPALDPTQLSFSAVNTSAVASVSFNTGVDAFQSDGDGKFDIRLGLPTSGNRFTAGEALVFDLSYTAPITAASFDFFSAPGGGQGSFHAAAKVQGIGLDGEDSGWIGDGDAPEPAGLALAAAALALFVRRRA